MFKRKKAQAPKPEAETLATDPLADAAQRAIERGKLIEELQRSAKSWRAFADACTAGCRLEATLSASHAGEVIYNFNGAPKKAYLAVKLDEVSSESLRAFTNNMAAIHERRLHDILG